MVKRYVGATIASFLLAGLASLMLSGVAYAEDAPAIAAGCSVDLPSEDGGELAIGAGVTVGELKLGLGTGTGALGVLGDADSGVVTEETPVVADATDEGCGLVQTTAKTVDDVGGTAVRALTREVPLEPPLDEQAPPADEPVESPPPDEEPPAAPESPAEPVGGENPPVEAPAYAPIAYATEVVAPLPAVEMPAIPPAPAQRGPVLSAGQDSSITTEKNAGRAHALPLEPAEQPKLPFLLAIATLAAVAAVLVRRWITRAAS